MLFPFYSGSSATATLFEGHQLSLEYLVRNLLKLYVDIEFTGSHTQVSLHFKTIGRMANLFLKSSCLEISPLFLIVLKLKLDCQNGDCVSVFFFFFLLYDVLRWINNNVSLKSYACD